MKTVNHDLQAWMHTQQERVEIALQKVLPNGQQKPEKLHEAMRYSALDGGKRFRPLLAYAAAAIGQANEAALNAAACAVELIHVYSLVHDDMPEMDDDSLRRGKPTCHVAYDQATALLVGDALQTLAFDVLSQDYGLPAKQQLQSVQSLAKASGSLGMAGGQAIDLDNVGHFLDQKSLQEMHGLKTGALIRVAVKLGALSCENITDETLAALDEYAKYLGLAFQVIDDVLDCEQDTKTLGKTAGKDAENDKPTYVSFMGLEPAKNYAKELVDLAKQSICHLSENAQVLCFLADFVIKRQN